MHDGGTDAVERVPDLGGIGIEFLAKCVERHGIYPFDAQMGSSCATRHPAIWRGVGPVIHPMPSRGVPAQSEIVQGGF